MSAKYGIYEHKSYFKRKFHYNDLQLSPKVYNHIAKFSFSHLTFHVAIIISSINTISLFPCEVISK